MPMATIPAGSLLSVTTGEYSDFHVQGIFRAISDIDPNSLLAEWLLLHHEQKKRHSFDKGGFLGWVARKGLLEPVDSYDWHLSCYGDADEMRCYNADTYEVTPE